MEGTRESPTDFLIRSLEEIEGVEDVVLVMRRKVNGVDEVDWCANDVPAWKLMGMLEFAKASAFQQVAEDDE